MQNELYAEVFMALVQEKIGAYIKVDEKQMQEKDYDDDFDKDSNGLYDEDYLLGLKLPEQKFIGKSNREFHIRIKLNQAPVPVWRELGHPQRKTIKNANMNSFVAGIKYRENYEEMLSRLEEGMELQIKPEPDNEFDPDALAVYHDEDHLGYIPKKDIPAVSLNMENECGIAEIEYVDEEHIDLVIPVSFHKLSTMSDDELENYRFYKTEKTKYEKGYVENSSPISKEEFLEGINQQKSNL